MDLGNHLSICLSTEGIMEKYFSKLGSYNQENIFQNWVSTSYPRLRYQDQSVGKQLLWILVFKEMCQYSTLLIVEVCGTHSYRVVVPTAPSRTKLFFPPPWQLPQDSMSSTWPWVTGKTVGKGLGMTLCFAEFLFTNCLRARVRRSRRGDGCSPDALLHQVSQTTVSFWRWGRSRSAYSASTGDRQLFLDQWFKSFDSRTGKTVGFPSTGALSVSYLTIL